MKTVGKEKNSIKIKFKIFIALMVAAVLLIPSAKASAKDVTKISGTTFKRNTNVATIHIGSNVSDISSNAFRGLMSLRSITVSENNPYFASYSNCLYNKNMTELLCFPAALTGAVIPDTVVSIRENALYGVNEGLIEQVRSVVKGQAAENLTEENIPGEHFVHTPAGIKWKKADGSLEDPQSEIMKQAAAVVDVCTTKDMTQKMQLESGLYDYVTCNFSSAPDTAFCR